MTDRAIIADASKVSGAQRKLVHCPECHGSGMRMGCTREIECFDCAGEGAWEEDEDEQLTEVRSDPFLNRRAA